MRIIHTADLHLGQIIYQHYDRTAEHLHFFGQLTKWCSDIHPDALLVSGDIFDIQQPSATVRKNFTDWFVQLHHRCPQMKIVLIAGNHDSATRIQSDKAVWDLANTHLIGLSPSVERLMDADGWQDDYIIRLNSGYIVALPYMNGERQELIQSILNRVAEENKEGKPVVLMGHLAVAESDVTGHNFVGTIKMQDVSMMGNGYDYLALGHIHKPQTIGHQEDSFKAEVTYPSPVVRYSGSVLHVSCDEAYPHSVSLVDIDRHGGTVSIQQLRVDELFHFYDLPLNGSSFTSPEEALDAVRQFVEEKERGYLRLRIDYGTYLPSNFNQLVYDELAPYDERWRYNPKILWTGVPECDGKEDRQLVFEVAELQQMTDPVEFIMKTKDQYPELDMDEVRDAFEEVKREIRRMKEE